MIRTIVVDDEWYNLLEVCDMVEKTGFMSVISRCRNGADALREAERVKPQAAFIDIEMPEMDGLELAEKLLELYPDMKIVFITGWNQYAVAAFELNAVDYIMKPLNKERFNKMVQRLQNQIGLMEPDYGKKLSIRCFGEFEVLIDGRPVIWQRIKAEELFVFLLMHHQEYIHKDVLIENIWPDNERSKSLPILQTSVYKIRNIFSACRNKVRLNYADNKYGLFLQDTDCDYFWVEQTLKQFDENVPETFDDVEAVYTLIQKGLLSGSDYLWTEAISENLNKKLMAAYRAMARHFQGQNAEKERNALEKAAKLSPTESFDQVRYLNVLMASGMIREALHYGEWLKDTLCREYDETLPDDITDLLENCKKDYE